MLCCFSLCYVDVVMFIFVSYVRVSIGHVIILLLGYCVVVLVSVLC